MILSLSCTAIIDSEGIVEVIDDTQQRLWQAAPYMADDFLRDAAVKGLGYCPGNAGLSIAVTAK